MTHIPFDDAIASMRAFNRMYTNHLGVLSDRLHGSAYSLTEVRVLFELAHRDDLAAIHLAGLLNLDSAYVSRILSRFKQEGLIERKPSDQDRRKRVIRLTDRGREVFADLDERSNEQVRELLQVLSHPERDDVVNSMDRIRKRFGREPMSPRIRPLRPGDLGWVVYSQGKGYWEQLGWNGEYEALVARIVADFAADHDPEREAGWIAEIEGEPIGSIFCVKADKTTAKLRLLWVEPSARGLRIGRSLVYQCLRFAREAGYDRMTLWTTSILGPARRLYRDAGFTLASEEPARLFGHDLIGEVWNLDLREGAPRS
ncbi:bifunctional helix-turn-helix transcriptional regulator/GNAT family N-acetyltransferase [Glycomyces buryatensis]|uniref:MarR family transcriptional regulator n=1 Tax=Glycomyces buryatensis TaxID=2570927 RepID=A0A4S8QJZ1_9ACTN|nr:helix-turn-helix domain-containing GNAT family N-acetyltransferase [Glycomyces buryatensis]THV41729.1 MarR family transcriptional regulator [Glycomyces buryatensis]